MTGAQGLDALLGHRNQQCLAILWNLLGCEKFPFDESLHNSLPELPGIYAISVKEALTGDYLRAGRTKQGKEGLRQRIYRNHLMGNQRGNLRVQLVLEGICSNTNEAKAWIRKHCVVQYFVV